MVDGRNAWQAHHGSHSVEVVSGMDDIWPKRQAPEIGSHRNGVGLKQSRSFPAVAAVGKDEMAEPLQFACQITDEQVGPSSLIEVLVCD
jgi:hypothetical protein